MSEGRKTRRFGGGMTGKAKEKAKLNREWQQISAVSLIPKYTVVHTFCFTNTWSLYYYSYWRREREREMKTTLAQNDKRSTN